MAFDPHAHHLLMQLLAEYGDSNQLDAGFIGRLHAQFDVMDELSRQLYPHDQELPFLKKLIKAMVLSYQERPQNMLILDQERMENPHWFTSQNWVGMMLYVERFCGDLFTFKTRIDYMESLGINMVHLMPLMQCPDGRNDGGYAVSDFRKVNPKLGTMDDISEISAILKKKQMLLTMDLVVNHTSEEHEWAQKALSGDQKYQNYYYMYADRQMPDYFESAMPQVFPDTAPGNFTYRKEINKWVMTVFHDYQWDLNYTNPDVFIEMLGNLLFLANHGADIIRLDALAFTWKIPGTTCQNLHQAHLLMQLFKACTQVVAPGTLFLAEAIVSPPEIVKYFGQPKTVSNECDIAYNATLMTLLWEAMTTKNNKLLHTTFYHIPWKPNGTTWLNYVRCHDDIGLGYEDQHAAWAGYEPGSHRRFIIDFLTGSIDWSFARGVKFMEDPIKGDARISGSLASLAGLEKAIDQRHDEAIELAIKRIVLLHSVILSWGGIPLLYMGDELGLTNDYSFEKDPDKQHDNRWMHRPKMDWKKAKNKADKHTIEGKIFQALRHLILVRKNTQAFVDEQNAQIIDTRNQHLFAYKRSYQSSMVFCVINLNDHPEPLYADVIAQAGLPIHGVLRDLVSGNEVTFGPFNYMMEPYQVIWLTL